jgi:hypothetical protein
LVMIFPAEGVSLNFFFQEVGWCHSIAFLCVVQSDGPCFIPIDDLFQKLSPSATQRESTSELSAQLYVGRLGFIEPNEHTLLHNLRHH